MAQSAGEFSEITFESTEKLRRETIRIPSGKDRKKLQGDQNVRTHSGFLCFSQVVNPKKKGKKKKYTNSGTVSPITLSVGTITLRTLSFRTNKSNKTH